ncbi:MAG: hypothetical protein LBH44_08000 [Treponema sp.]|jgi:hypothetical protein|nr:hypothetical protein [Treponema sp.]
MFVNIKYSRSAFKHDITEADVHRAFINAVFDDIIDEASDKHLLIRFDGKGRILEILYNFIDDETIRVFHAMRCRNEWRKLCRI